MLTKMQYYQTPMYITPAYIGEMLVEKCLKKAAYFSMGMAGESVENKHIQEFIERTKSACR